MDKEPGVGDVGSEDWVRSWASGAGMRVWHWIDVCEGLGFRIYSLGLGLGIQDKCLAHLVDNRA